MNLCISYEEHLRIQKNQQLSHNGFKPSQIFLDFRERTGQTRELAARVQLEHHPYLTSFMSPLSRMSCLATDLGQPKLLGKQSAVKLEWLVDRGGRGINRFCWTRD